MNTIHRIKCGNGNCYLIANGKDAVLVDTSKREFYDDIVNACKPFNIKLIVLTHVHIDHAENAIALSNLWGVPIAINERDYELIEDYNFQKLCARSFLGKVVLLLSLKLFKNRKVPEFKPTVFLSEGDTLISYGVNGKVLELPGHTNGSIGIDVDEKNLIVGDALMNMFYPTISMLYHDRKKVLESAKKISNLGDRIIYFGHGDPVNNKKWVH